MKKEPVAEQRDPSESANITRRSILLGGTAIAAASTVLTGNTQIAQAQTQAQTPDAGGAAKQPNILVIWGDDIGTWNISHNNRGMMGYRTPNIDRIAQEGLSFTDYYGQQSCTAGRAAFIGGNVPVRTGMTKVGLPGAKEGWQESDVTMATVLKSQGYATGQFGKNHQGDRDEHLPTNHGFDEFFGNLYHLNAEEEPENRDYPKDPEFRKRFGPRGVIHSFADGKIEDTGPLTKKRMETIDEESLAAAKDFITRQNQAGTPFFVWWNGTRMHFRTHVKPEHTGISGPSGDEYHDGMVEHDMHVGELLKLLDELGIAENTVVMYSTDNGPHFNTWPDAATTPFRSEKNSNWEGAYRVPAFMRWPARFPAGKTLNGIVAHEDWLPTFGAIAGAPDIKEKLLEGVELNGRRYRNYIDGYNQLEYLEGKTDQSPRHEFWYVNDDGQVVAARYDDWKVVFLENRGEAFGVWREPFTELRVPLLFNLRRDPFEKAQHNANTYDDWFLERAFVVVPIQGLAAKFLQTMKEYPPSQSPGSFNLTKIEESLKAGMRN
ncbi:sulfatase-like hydrolase/transferase [Sinorhizobium medicae]|uniref:arylsulfatase n=1 Tax=Sinorhizobium medicae TaxID=110321 RepID=UPI00299ED429|nr:arylsulfatase [Sinorhizobium medicae]MDX0492384.1 sulfatase-like hydrolase/transferase [Sinorhizobium medicae]MDX0541811.1 sulfatase-like hydrolase/transferase [Sinorhizobium medicae]MDX0720615.1 sulfatase-like hydrolase/transferase [Sinorhizobium medicae]MDX0997960.1 sulfatase-like hydrolase/transferase [Sinorhizobium medicae]MDX1039670.1 sulfatase-like hydrolase/transferase [Sinorhizobium medicae]